LAILKGIKLLKEVKADTVEVLGDLQLVINEFLGVYECNNEILLDYFEESRQVLDEFVSVVLEHIPKAQNEEANRLAQFTYGYQRRASILFDDVLPNDWRKEILDDLKNPS
jgi:ribonuclease HI